MMAAMQKNLIFALLTLLWSATLSAATSTGSESESQRDWNFRVYLDDKEIGYHNFRLNADSDNRVLTTEAEFDVKLLFITVYRYRHTNEETWDGTCLQSIDSQTNANGKRFSVNGRQEGGKFDLEARKKSDIPGDCVMTFAYWNPEFLNQQYLLNPQTGEYTAVDVQPLGEQEIIVQGREVTADRYRVSGPNVELEVWYSKKQGEWLGLQSTTKEGRKIRYELV